MENFSINLPANEKKEKPRKLNVVFTNNPNKLSIDIKTGTVYADKKFWNSLNEIQQRFVIAHELGHFKYYNETKADKFAAYLLLKSGYNPTQIVACINSTLSENSHARKNRIYNFLKTVKK
ncbi:MAG: hypothetical protein GYA62_15320 [Bacteroidales bacterium]|nr:hypothetical protein [Bacteroidales bacterium]